MDAETGDEEWSITNEATLISSPAVVDGTVYVGWGWKLLAVDAATGEQQWAFTEPGNDVHSSPTVVANPAQGSSIDSRVRLGTLGHYSTEQRPATPTSTETDTPVDQATGTETNSTVDPQTEATATPTETTADGPGFVIGGAVVTLGTIGQLIRRGSVINVFK